MTREELNEVFKAVGCEMQEENLAAVITARAVQKADSVEDVDKLVSAVTAASIEYSQELLFRVLARVLKNA